MEGHVLAVEKYLTYDIFHESIDQEYCHKRTALHWAALGGYEPVLWRLRQNGADVRKVSGDKKTALHLAVDSGDDEAKNNHDRTPLSPAAMRGHAAIVKLLVEMGGEC
ncbi:ankyrin repeat-containing domain protein [Trichoderma camerunense]